MGFAAILWVVLHFTVGDGAAQEDDSALVSIRTKDIFSPADRETVQGSWGVPWGGGAGGQGGAGADAVLQPDTLPSRGADDPVLALIEFGDYECEFTQKAERTLENVLARFDRDVRLVFVHNPLPIHDHAMLAAQAAEAARMQDRFGEMHERLLEAKGAVDRDGVVRLAREIGLDVERFRKDLDGAAKARVASMVAFAKTHGLSGTPHFLIGGHVVEGARPEEIFSRVIESALEDARARLAFGTSRRDVFAQSLKFLEGKAD